MSTSDVTPSKKRKRSIEAAKQALSSPMPPEISISGNASVHIGDQYFLGKDAEQDAIDTLTRSLHFPEILRRYENIREQHNGTYEWIFRSDGTTSSYDFDSNDTSSTFYRKQPWDPFVDWLHGKELIYWISGKPGSGKSTLMKHLVDSLQISDNQTESALVNLSFWFWEAGQELERNLEGCLRSLLWQGLQCSSTQRMVFGVLRQHVPGSTWTRSRLIKSFKLCLSTFENADISVRIFLDGLDESGPDAIDILELLSDLSQQNKMLKVCISSRPEQLLFEELSNYPKLRLHDLNARDIHKVIQEDFVENPKVIRLVHGKDKLAAQLTETLIDKAQGVFLWVSLAIRSLLRGLACRDSIQILEARLEQLPDDLDDLYSRMLSRNECDMKFYREDAAFYLRLALDYPRLSLLEFCFASTESLRRRMLDPPFESWDDVDLDNKIVSWTEDFLTWITMRTGGLLETTKDKHVNLRPGTLTCLTRFANIRVNFIHRTARSYLLDTKTGQGFLSACTLTQDQLKSISFEAHLIRWYILRGIGRENPGMMGRFDPQRTYYVSPSSASIAKAILIWSEMSLRDLLRCTTTLPGTTSSDDLSFPSTEDGVIDACKVCCRFNWYRDAQRILLANAQSHEDVAYLSTLLVFAAYSVFDPFSKPERDAFLRSVLDLGGDPFCEVDSTYDGRISVLPLITWSDIGKDLSLLIDQSIMQQPQWTTTRCLPSIEFLERYSRTEPCLRFMKTWVFWAELNMSDLMRLKHRQKLPSTHSKPSRVWIVARVGSRLANDDPLFAVTEEESRTLLSMVDKFTTELQIPSYKRPVDIMRNCLIVIGDDDGLRDCVVGQDLLRFLEDLAKQSHPFRTILEALLFVGKTEEAVRRYVADTEVDLRRSEWRWTEANISSWKSWFLGPS